MRGPERRMDYQGLPGMTEIMANDLLVPTRRLENPCRDDARILTPCRVHISMTVFLTLPGN